jgi:hypothetical protein
MNDGSWLMAQITDLVNRVEGFVERRLDRDERQDFIDRAAIERAAQGHLSSEKAYALAEDLWAERQKRREQPGERELVVRYLNRWARHGSGNLAAAADAIKAGKHLEPDPDRFPHLADELWKPHG